jgi:hypothetical protein
MEPGLPAARAGRAHARSPSRRGFHAHRRCQFRVRQLDERASRLASQLRLDRPAVATQGRHGAPLAAGSPPTASSRSSSPSARQWRTSSPSMALPSTRTSYQKRANKEGSRLLRPPQKSWSVASGEEQSGMGWCAVRVNALAPLYTSAKTALAKLIKVDEVKKIHDKAVAMEVYAKQAEDPFLAAKAPEFLSRSTRRLGELMAEMREADKLAKGTRGQLVSRGVIGGAKITPPKDETTLEQYGIDKNLAKQARKATTKLLPRVYWLTSLSRLLIPLLVPYLPLNHLLGCPTLVPSRLRPASFSAHRHSSDASRDAPTLQDRRICQPRPLGRDTP